MEARPAPCPCPLRPPCPCPSPCPRAGVARTTGQVYEFWASDRESQSKAWTTVCVTSTLDINTPSVCTKTGACLQALAMRMLPIYARALGAMPPPGCPAPAAHY
jgi:hypothetical protein